MAHMWYAVQAKPHAGGFANSNLQRMGFVTLMPMVTKLRKLRNGRSMPVEVPLFGPYFFVQFDVTVDRWQSITSAYGVRRLFSASPEIPIPVPRRSIDTLLTCLPSEAKSAIHPGAIVRVIEGPLAQYNVAGVCRWTDGERVQLFLDIMGGERIVEFAVTAVALIEDTRRAIDATADDMLAQASITDNATLRRSSRQSIDTSRAVLAAADRSLRHATPAYPS